MFDRRTDRLTLIDATVVPQTAVFSIMPKQTTAMVLPCIYIYHILLRHNYGCHHQQYFPPSQFSHRFGYEAAFPAVCILSNVNLIQFRTQFYTVVVKSSRVVYDKDRKCKFAVYEFEIKRGRQKKTIFYRYSEIRQLHEYLCSTNVGSIANLVSFPSKTWFTRLDDKFLDERYIRFYIMK